MHRHARRRSRLVLGSELLESRELLNAHMPHHDFAHVAKVATPSHMQINGTLSGTAPFTTDPTNPNAGADSYFLSGSSSTGATAATGTDSWMGYPVSSSTYKDLYYGGSWTMTLGNGSTVAISYVGSGKEPISGGPWTSSVAGRAIGTSGSLVGHAFAFTAKVSGNSDSANDPLTLHFKLKS